MLRLDYCIKLTKRELVKFKCGINKEFLAFSHVIFFLLELLIRIYITLKVLLVLPFVCYVPLGRLY